MSTRRFEREEPAPRSKCISCLCVSWKVFTCLFSHVMLIALVVAYCLGGAFLFEHLESGNEKTVSRMIVNLVSAIICWLSDYLLNKLSPFFKLNIRKIEMFIKWKSLYFPVNEHHLISNPAQSGPLHRLLRPFELQQLSMDILARYCANCCWCRFVVDKFFPV